MPIYRMTVGNGSPSGQYLTFYKNDTQVATAGGGYVTISQSGDIGVWTFSSAYALQNNTALINAWGSYPVSGEISGYPPAAGQTVKILMADGRELTGIAMSPPSNITYDFDALQEPNPLDPPVINPSYAYRKITFTFELPEGASGFKIETSEDEEFTDPTAVTATESPFEITGLSGTLYFRAKFIASTGPSDDSPWSNVVSHYFIVIPQLDAPVITAAAAGKNAIVVSGLAVENASGYAVSYKPDSGDVWTDRDVTDIVDSGGNAVIDGLSPATLYAFRAMALGDGVNYFDSEYSDTVSASTEDIPRLEVPNVKSPLAVNESTILVELSGLDQRAAGWRVKCTDESDVVLMVDVPRDIDWVNLTALAVDTQYTIEVIARGDGINYRDSEWTEAVTVDTLPPRNGNFYVWDAVTTWSKSGVKKQNIMFRAKITDLDDNTIIPRDEVESIELTVYKHTNLTVAESVEVVKGYNAISVPLTALLTTPDAQGYNFRYVPDQRVCQIFSEAGRYEVQFYMKLLADNPLFVIYQDVIVY